MTREVVARNGLHAAWLILRESVLHPGVTTVVRRA